MPDIELLRLFRSAARAGSLAGAARELRISPSLASRRISALEASIGTRLILRSTRNLQLTDAGATFLKWADDTVNGFEDVTAEIGMQAQEPVGLLRIASNDYMGQHYLLDAVQQFRQRYPGVRLALSLQDDPVHSIKLGYDIAIHAGSMPGDALIGRRILSYRRIICASPDYLARHDVPTCPGELERHDCLVHFRNDTRRWVFRTSAGHTLNQEIRPLIEINSYPLLLELAARGLGIIRIADIMAGPLIARGQLEEIMSGFRSVEADGSDPAIWLTYAERPRIARVRLMADFLVGQLSAMGG